ncbi:MAG: hypothetical protein NZ455_13875 [Bacteroidia bacterium]|nr:hypothetical protein [Bacteroidia bacterium]MDW8347235.1 hypothetical protein [Bacteroidia bacterium]
MGVSLRLCPQGRRAAGCAIASVLRTAHAPSACLTQAVSRLSPFIQSLTL